MAAVVWWVGRSVGQAGGAILAHCTGNGDLGGRFTGATKDATHWSLLEQMTCTSRRALCSCPRLFMACLVLSTWHVDCMATDQNGAVPVLAYSLSCQLRRCDNLASSLLPGSACTQQVLPPRASKKSPEPLHAATYLIENNTTVTYRPFYGAL